LITEVSYVASNGESYHKARKIRTDIILMHIYFKWNIINVIDVATKIKELDIPIIFLISHSKSPKNQNIGTI